MNFWLTVIIWTVCRLENFHNWSFKFWSTAWTCMSNKKCPVVLAYFLITSYCTVLILHIIHNLFNMTPIFLIHLTDRSDYEHTRNALAAMHRSRFCTRCMNFTGISELFALLMLSSPWVMVDLFTKSLGQAATWKWLPVWWRIQRPWVTWCWPLEGSSTKLLAKFKRPEWPYIPLAVPACPLVFYDPAGKTELFSDVVTLSTVRHFDITFWMLELVEPMTIETNCPCFPPYII